MKEILTKFVLVMILLFLLYKFYPWNRIVEALDEKPFHFLITGISLNKNINVPNTIKKDSIIQLTKNTSSVPITIGKYKTKTLYRIVDYKGNTSFKYNNYPVWISEIDKKSNKIVTKESTLLELICFQFSSDEKNSIMKSIGTITVSTPLVYKLKDMTTTTINIPKIFYLIHSKDKKKYIMHGIDGKKYDNVDIDFSTSINNATTSITINKNSTLYVTSIFNLATSMTSNIISTTSNIISKVNSKGKKKGNSKGNSKGKKKGNSKGKKKVNSKGKKKGKKKSKSRSRSKSRRSRSKSRRSRSKSRRRTTKSRRRTTNSIRRRTPTLTRPTPTRPTPTTPAPTTTTPAPTTTTPAPTTTAPTKLVYSSVGSMWGTWT